MIWDIDKDREIIDIPHRQEYAAWISRLSSEQIQDIKAEILRRIRIGGDEIATAGWLPGPDWSGTPFQPIYEYACLRNRDAAGKCFGIFVWETLMEHNDCWGFGRYEVNNVPIQSMTYFKLREP